MRVCERQNWTLDAYRALSPDEQLTWLAWELDRQREMKHAIESITQGKPYAEQVTARALLALLRNG
jgi:hypothetical protein